MATRGIGRSTRPATSAIRRAPAKKVGRKASKISRTSSVAKTATKPMIAAKPGGKMRSMNRTRGAMRGGLRRRRRRGL